MSESNSKLLPISGSRLDEEGEWFFAILNSLDMYAQITDKSLVGKLGAVQNAVQQFPLFIVGPV